MCRVLTIIIVLGFLVFPLTIISFAQAPDTIWTKTYGETYVSSTGLMAKQTSDGGYIVFGNARQNQNDPFCLYLVKTDSMGDTIWTRLYTGNNISTGNTVLQTNDDGFIIIGSIILDGHNDTDILLLKTDQNGDSLWAKTFGGVEDDWGNSIVQAVDGGFVILGSTSSFGVDSDDVYLIKTNDNGDSLWSRIYDFSMWESGKCIISTLDSCYMIGLSSSFHQAYSGILFKIDMVGDSLWSRIPGASISLDDIQQTSDDGFIISGSTVNPMMPTPGHAYLLKVNVNGDSLWMYEPSFLPGGVGGALESPLGGYIAVGSIDYQLNLFKTDIDGNIIWEMPFVNYVYKYGRSIEITNDGCYIISGTTTSDNMFLMKMHSEVSGIKGDDLIPINLQLGENYPNPFNASTAIKYDLPKTCDVTIDIYDILGRRAATLVQEKQQAGRHSATWNADDQSSGVYFYSIQAGDYTETKKMLLLK